MQRENRSVARWRYWLCATLALAILTPPCAIAGNANEYLTKYIAGLNAAMPPKGDPVDAANLFASDGVQIHVLGEPQNGVQRGTSEIKAFFAGFKEFFSDWTHVEKSRLTRGDSAVWEGVAQGHHRETGKPIRLPMVFFLDFDNSGAVREARVYLDGRSIGDQLK